MRVTPRSIQPSTLLLEFGKYFIHAQHRSDICYRVAQRIQPESLDPRVEEADRLNDTAHQQAVAYHRSTDGEPLLPTLYFSHPAALGSIWSAALAVDQDAGNLRGPRLHVAQVPSPLELSWRFARAHDDQVRVSTSPHHVPGHVRQDNRCVLGGGEFEGRGCGGEAVVEQGVEEQRVRLGEQRGVDDDALGERGRLLEKDAYSGQERRSWPPGSPASRYTCRSWLRGAGSCEFDGELARSLAP
jgi:hypothetical protein